jgi:hypothetical protein
VYIVVWRETSATSIDLVVSIGSFDPVKQIFEDTLIKLMEDVGRYRAVDVYKREITPKWLSHGLDAQLPDPSAHRIPRILGKLKCTKSQDYWGS